MSENLQPLSASEIESMRNIVLKHDQAQSHNEFDLSKPQVAPYVYRKFPKMVYLHDKCVPAHEEARKVQGEMQMVHVPAVYASRMVNNEDELKKASKAGFSEKPPVFHVEQVEEWENEPAEV